MPQLLPVSNLINVQILLSQLAAQAQSLNTGLVVGDSDIIPFGERARFYSSSADVGTEFGTTAPEYLASVAYFSQQPRPKEIMIGRWVKTASKGRLVGGPLKAPYDAVAGWNSLPTNSVLGLNINGTPYTLTALDFTAAANLNGVAAVFQAKLTSLTAPATVVYDSLNKRFIFTSDTTGVTSIVTVVGAAGLIDESASLNTTDGAVSYPGAAAEEPIVAFNDIADRFGQRFYGVGFGVSSITIPQTLTIAAAVEASVTKRTLWVTDQDANALIDNVTMNIGKQLAALGYKKTGWIYSSTNPYAGISLMSRAININYNGNNTVITLMYKQLPGVIAEGLSTTQSKVVDKYKGNVFAGYDNSTAIVQYGKMASGEYIDVITGTDWLAVTIQNNVYNLLYTSPTKIPQTDAGQNLIESAVEQVCAQGVVNGLGAPGTWLSNGFGELAQNDFMPKGYYIYSAPMANQLVADRAARKSQPVQVAFKLSGAVHTVGVLVNVNQ